MIESVIQPAQSEKKTTNRIVNTEEPIIEESKEEIGLYEEEQSSLFDPLAIVQELGEAEDSPNINVTKAISDKEQVTQVDRADALVNRLVKLSPIDGSIWAEIAGEFKLPLLKKSKYARLHEKRLTHSEGFFSEFLQKSDLYLPYVWAEVKRRGLPGELALLPYVESAYSPWAVSHAGAVGMWQIMPGTARVLKLELGQTCDQRRDVIHSTQAALNYLEQLHLKFGDWLLAIAAYNAGPGRVERAVKRNKKAGRPMDFWSLRLPRETTRYVPRLLVIRNLIQNAAEQQIKLPKIDKEISFRSLSLKAPMEVALVSELSGLQLKEIRRYNPCIRSWITPAQKPYQIHLPHRAAQKFSIELNNVSIRDYVRTRPYRVRSGDTLSTIAGRTGASVKELMTLNGMRSTRIVAGKTIRVPSTSENINKQLTKLDLGDGYGDTIRYKVRRGDSLWKIAKRFKTSVKAIRKLNATSNLIRPGQWLVVPVN